MDIHVQHDRPQPAAPVHHLTLRAAAGTNAIEVSVRLHDGDDPSALLDALRRMTTEVSRRVTPVTIAIGDLYDEVGGIGRTRLAETRRWRDA